MIILKVKYYDKFITLYTWVNKYIKRLILIAGGLSFSLGLYCIQRSASILFELRNFLV